VLPHVLIHVKMPDFSSRAMNRAWREAVDAALNKHKISYLPIHFTPEARHRYGGVYMSRSARRKNPHFKEYLATLSPKEVADMWEWRTVDRRVRAFVNQLTPEQRSTLFSMPDSDRRKLLASVAATRMKRGHRKAGRGTADPGASIPLVDTGLTRRMVVSGSPTFSRPVSRRRMTLAVPRYMKYSPPDQYNKEQALKAVTDAEVQAFAKAVETALDAKFRMNG